MTNQALDYKWFHNAAMQNSLPIFIENQYGEFAVIETSQNPEGGKPLYVLQTLQDNDWIRVNTFHPDGWVEETFEHENLSTKYERYFFEEQSTTRQLNN